MPLQAIYESVAGLGSDEYPLLDPAYSPNTLMPVIDFSPTLRNLVIDDDWETILELLTELAPISEQAELIVKTFRAFPIDSYLSANKETLSELVAIFMLTSRVYSSEPDGNYWLLTSLLQSTLCCNKVQIIKDAQPLLLRSLWESIVTQRNAGDRDNIRDPTIADLEILGHTFPNSELCHKLAAIPVTSRAVVFDALTRDWGHSVIRKLRPELYYGERQFGNNSDWNRYYVEWTGIFVPPPDDLNITKLLSKEQIRSLADKFSITIPKSYSRSRMIQFIRENDLKAYSELFKEAVKDSAIVDPNLRAELDELVTRRSRIEYACRALARL